MSEFLKRIQGMPANRLALLANELQIQLQEARGRAAEPIAIIGMAGRYPGGCDTVESFWRMLAEGRDAIEDTPAERWDADALYDPDPDAFGKIVTRRGSFIRDFDCFDADFFGIPAKEAATMDPQHRLLLEVGWEALEDTGSSPEKRKGTPTGVFIGICTTDYVDILTHSDTAWGGYLAQGTAHSIAAGRLSYVFGFEGPCLAIDTACSSSLIATHLACRSLQSGECDLALAGGVSVLLSPMVSIDLSRARILSPSGLCRPFDARADGYIRGEGCGMLVLKRLSEALRDGDPIRAVIRGSAVNHGGRSSGLLAPRGSAQEAVIGAAVAAARVAPSAIGYVEASSVGTALGDPIEMEVLRKTLCQDRAPENPLFVGSVKTNIGHLEGASGVAALTKVVLSLERGAIPPHLHFEQPNPHVAWSDLPVRIPRETAPWPSVSRPRLAAVSSFSISGANAHLILEEAPPPAAHQGEGGRALAADPERHLFKTSASETEDVRLRKPAQTGFPDRPLVLPFSAKTEDALLRLCGRFAERLEAAPEEEYPAICFTAATGRVHHPQRLAVVGASREEALRKLKSSVAERPGRPAVSDRRRPGPPTVAFIFPARGDFRFDLLRELAETEPPLREALGNQDSGAASGLTWFSLQYTLAQMWRRWGVEPAFVLGEEGGECAAACVAGLFGLDAGLGLMRARSELIENVEGAAITQPLSVSTAVPTDRENWPRLFDSLRHTPWIAPYEQALSAISFQPEQVRIVSGLSGRRTGRGELSDRDYWIRQLGGASRFAEGLFELENSGVDLFLVMGFEPDASLEASPDWARASRAFREGVNVVSSLMRDQAAGPPIAHGLAALYEAGVDIDWDAVYEGRNLRRTSLPTYPFERRRFWPSSSLQPSSPVISQAAVTSRSARPSILEESAGAPRDEKAQTAARVVSEELARVLGCQAEALDPDASLIDLGLDSIRALQLKDRLTYLLKAELPVAQFVHSPSIRELAEFLASQAVESEAAAVWPDIVPNAAGRYEPFPLTDIQQAYWVGRIAGFELGGVSTHAYFEYQIAGLDVQRLERAIQRVIDRHDMLRAVILPAGRQVVLKETPDYRVKTEDLRALEAAGLEAALGRIRNEMSHEVRPADRWPLFEVRAARLPADLTRLHLSIDLLIVDAWSMQILAREVARLYEFPDSPLPPLDLRFRDYVLAQSDIERTGIYQRSERYWKARMVDLPPAPELPIVKNAASVGNHQFVRRTCRLDVAAWTRLQSHARKTRVSPTVVVLAAFAHVLREWAKSPRFTINLTLFHRPPLHAGINDLVGDFTSLTLLDADLRGAASFETRARQLQQQLWSDLDHRYFGGVRVLREIAIQSGRPMEAIMPVVFTAALGLSTSSAEIAGVFQRGEVIYAVSQTPQVWLDHQVFENGNELVLVWDAVEELFPPGMLDDMFAAYRDLLEHLAREDRAWDEPVGSLTPARQLERRRAVNAVQAPVSTELLHTLFFRHVAQNPDRPAVIAPGSDRSDPGLTLTYAELARRAGALAGRLRQHGAAPNQLIAIVMEKGWEQVAAALAILESGAAYVPIDAGTPHERLVYLLEHCGVRVVLTQERFRKTVKWPACVEAVLSDFADPGGAEAASLAPVQQPQDLAYVIFTSGSSGLPKGVMIDHRGAVNTILDVNRRFGVGPEDRTLALSSLSFDLSVYDIFGLLAAGGAVVMPDAAFVRDPAHWLDQVETNQVTLWNSVPALMQLLTQYAASSSRALPASLRVVLLSGDWIPVGLPGEARALSARGQELAMISLGGATEASIWSVFHPIDAVDPSLPSIPYGRPLTNQALHVLDSDLSPRPDWAPGDLYIEGAGLAQGYWGDPEKTNAAFIENPRTRKRLYRTGDIARSFPDGTLEFLGRDDFQVKIQGFRVELGEIEANLRRHRSVGHAVALVVGESQAQKRLTAGVAGAAGQRPDPVELREFLATRLPEYMLPSPILVLDKLPLTANGKVDVRELARMASGSRTAAALASSPSDGEDPLTRQLIELVKTDLQIPELDANTSLLSLGANSLDMLRVVNEIERQLGFRPKVEQFFRRPTIAGLRELRRRHEANEPVAQEGDLDDLMDLADGTSDVVLDPKQRDALKRQSLQLRRFEEGRTRVSMPVAEPGISEVEALAARRSYREFDPRPLALEQLFSTLRCLRRLSIDGRPKHGYASAGGLYPVQTYLYMKWNRVEGVPQGTYYYDPLAQDLVLLKAGAEIDASIHVAYNQAYFAASAFSVFLVAETHAPKLLYGDLSLHLASLEAGLMTQLLDMNGPAFGVGFCQIGTISFEGIRELFELNDNHILVHSLLGGRIPGTFTTPPAPTAGDGREEGTI